MKWFKHDANASMNAKLKKLMLKFGLEGYGLYWYCIELVAQQVEPHNLTFELEHDSEIIGHSVGISKEKVQVIMQYMIYLNLFEGSDGVITCLKLAKRVDEYTQKLLKNRDTLPMMSGQNPTKSALLDKNRIEQNRIDKNKYRERRNTSNKECVTQSNSLIISNGRCKNLKEASNFFNELGHPQEAEKFFDYYDSNGWKVGRHSMKDWKAAARNWCRRIKEKQPSIVKKEYKPKLGCEGCRGSGKLPDGRKCWCWS